MRDPKRIPRILKLLETVWRQNPDTRLGQLLLVLLQKDTPDGLDIWEVEDHVTEKRLREWKQR